MRKSKIRGSQRKSLTALSGLKVDIDKKGIVHLYATLSIISLNILIIAAIIIFISSKLPQQVPLYYGLPRSDRQLATPVSLILPISIASLFITSNAIIAYFTKTRFLKNLLVIGGFFTALLAIITIVKIIFLIL